MPYCSDGWSVRLFCFIEFSLSFISNFWEFASDWAVILIFNFRCLLIIWRVGYLYPWYSYCFGIITAFIWVYIGSLLRFCGWCLSFLGSAGRGWTWNFVGVFCVILTFWRFIDSFLRFVSKAEIIVFGCDFRAFRLFMMIVRFAGWLFLCWFG